MRPTITIPAFIFLAALVFPRCAVSQNSTPSETQDPSTSRSITTDDYNQRLGQLSQNLSSTNPKSAAQDYHIGPQDLLEISVFEAPELNRSVRVSASGEISLALLGAVQAANLTPKELEFVLEELLRRSYMKDPHVGVFVQQMQSHPVSVFGAVKKPGVFQVDAPKSLVEILSMAEGLAEDAGDTVIVMRGADLPGATAPASEPPGAPMATSNGSDANAPRSLSEPSSPTTVEISLKNLLESSDDSYNVVVYPGDVVKVTRAGVVYVEGNVKKPGGFMLKTNENITVLQAVALAEGLTRTAAGSHARIMRTDETGTRTEIPIDIDKILAGTIADPVLRPKDIVFVPNSTGKSVFYGSTQAVVSLGSAAVYRW